MNKAALDALVKDDGWRVRYKIAKRGHKELLDVLVKDESWFVRYTVAKHGHKEHLDALVNDADPIIRREVARHEQSSTSRRVAFVVLVVGIVLSILSPTNTPKNTPHDREAFRIVPEQSTGAKVQDLTKQPKKTDEERKEHFDNLTNSWKEK